MRRGLRRGRRRGTLAETSPLSERPDAAAPLDPGSPPVRDGVSRGPGGGRRGAAGRGVFRGRRARRVRPAPGRGGAGPVRVLAHAVRHAVRPSVPGGGAGRGRGRGGAAGADGRDRRRRGRGRRGGRGRHAAAAVRRRAGGAVAGPAGVAGPGRAVRRPAAGGSTPAGRFTTATASICSGNGAVRAFDVADPRAPRRLGDLDLGARSNRAFACRGGRAVPVRRRLPVAARRGRAGRAGGRRLSAGNRG